MMSLRLPPIREGTVCEAVYVIQTQRKALDDRFGYVPSKPPAARAFAAKCDALPEVISRCNVA